LLLPVCPEARSGELNAADPLEPPPLTQIPVRYDLAEYLEVAEVQRPIDRITFALESERRFLVSGWNNPEPIVGKKGKTSGGRAWTAGRIAAVDFPILERAERELRLRLVPPPVDAAVASLSDDAHSWTLRQNAAFFTYALHLT
jgi:hypothetical protein